MLALKGYEKNSGFSVLNTDELFFICGGSFNFDTPIGPFPPPLPDPPLPPSIPTIPIK